MSAINLGEVFPFTLTYIYVSHKISPYTILYYSTLSLVYKTVECFRLLCTKKLLVDVSFMIYILSKDYSTYRQLLMVYS